MKKIIFHTPYKIGRLDSGSGVRPFKLYREFIRQGYEVFLLDGNVPERKKKFKKLKKEKMKNYLFCYSEPSTYPVHPILDYQIYFFLKKYNIPIGIYYRDAYWRFPSYFEKKGFQRLTLKFRYRFDLFVFNKAAKVFFYPSESFSKLFKTRIKKVVLPPAGEIKNQDFYNRRFKNPPTGIYVGGISRRYGLEILLKAFQLLNQKKKVNLNLVCREDEFQREFPIIKPFFKKNWLSIYHLSGEELENIYKKLDFGIIPRRIDRYNSLAMPVKLFEYLSYGLPIVATDCYEMAKFIRENKVGLICRDNINSLAKSILELICNQKLYNNFSKNTYQILIKGNLWMDRVKIIEQNLGGR